MNKDNFTMLCDFYELTMANGYFKNAFYKRTTYFDVFSETYPTTADLRLRQDLTR